MILQVVALNQPAEAHFNTFMLEDALAGRAGS